MIEPSNYMTNDERQAWLTSARAWGEAFPQFAEVVARIEARLLEVGPGDGAPAQPPINAGSSPSMVGRCPDEYAQRLLPY